MNAIRYTVSAYLNISGDQRCIYLAQSIEFPNRYKIGMSINPENRVKYLCSDFSQYLGSKGMKLLKYIHSGQFNAEDVEHAFHYTLRDMAQNSIDDKNNDVIDIWNEIFEINNQKYVQDLIEAFNDF